MDNWIFVESYHNWQQDFKNNFKYLGIDVKKFQLRKPKKGDQIFTYISKIKKISDQREILSDEIVDTPDGFNYDKIFTKCIPTKLVKLLPEENWIKLDEVINKLELFVTSKSPGLKLLNAPLKLNSFDLKILSNIFFNR
jgi:hypothetical protein